MSDKITVNPDSIRGLGDIVSPKIVSDFDVFNVKLSTGSAVIDDETLRVFNHNYLPGSKLNDLTYLLCVPTEATSATVSFKLVHVTGANITGATVNVTVNDTVVGSCTTDGDGVGSYSIDLTGAFLEDSLFHVKLSYEGTSSVSGCFRNIIFWHGDITGLALTSDMGLVDENISSHLLATLTGTNMQGETTSIPGQEVMVFEEYTPGLKVEYAPKIASGDSINITARIIDTVDHSHVNLPEQLISVYEEYTPGIMVKSSKPKVADGGSIDIVAQFIDLEDGNYVALENQAVTLYEEYTPGVRVKGPKVIEEGDEITLTAELCDISDGSRVCMDGETIELFEDYHPNVALTSNHDTIITGDSATLTATLLDDDGSAISDETITVYEEYTPGMVVTSNPSIISMGDIVKINGELIDTLDNSRVRLSGETISLYHEFDEEFYYVSLYHNTVNNVELITAQVRNQFGDVIPDVLVEFNSSWSGEFTDVMTNSSGRASVPVRNPVYDNYWFVTLPEIYGDNVVAEINLLEPHSPPVVSSVGLRGANGIVALGEYVNLVTTVKDQYGVSVPGQTVDFMMVSEPSDVLVHRVDTNSVGMAVKSILGVGSGLRTYYVKAKNIESEPVDIIDAVFYDRATNTKNRTWDTQSIRTELTRLSDYTELKRVSGATAFGDLSLSTSLTGLDLSSVAFECDMQWIGTHTSSIMTLRDSGGNQKTSWLKGDGFSDGNWHHLKIVVEGLTAHTWIDGTQITDKTIIGEWIKFQFDIREDALTNFKNFVVYQLESEEPTPVEPVPTTLTLTSNKNTISAYDSETATLTATVKDQNGSVMEGQTVTFKKGSSTLATETTNSSGVATYDYSASGSGDVTITVECGSLSQTQAIEDCNYYSTTEYKQNTDGITLDIALPSTFKLEYDIKPTSRSTSGNGSGCYLRLGATINSGVWAGQLTSAGKHGLMPKPSGTTQYCTTNTVLNTDNHITVVYDGTTATYTCNGESVSLSASNLSKINGVVPTANNGLKNIKLKPL